MLIADLLVITNNWNNPNICQLGKQVIKYIHMIENYSAIKGTN